MQEKNLQNAIEVIKRLKKSLKITTDIELSEFLNIRPNTISTWKKRNSVDFDSIISICELYELDLNEIFLNKKTSSPFVGESALVSRDVQFQYSKDDDNSGLLEILPKYSFPFVVAENSRVFQVVSNNMFPVLEENTFAICEKIEIDDIIKGSVVVLVSKTKGMFINRIAKSKYDDTTYIMTNEDDFYNDINIDASDIREVWNICGVLSYDINNQSKVRFINDSIKKISKFLKKVNIKE